MWKSVADSFGPDGVMALYIAIVVAVIALAQCLLFWMRGKK